MRWIISIVLLAAFAAGSYFLFNSWNDLKDAQAELEFLRGQTHELEKLDRQYAQQEMDVTIIHEMWDEIDSAGLDPDQWIEYPLRISKSLAWEELEHVLTISGNSPTGAGGYWFKPNSLRVTRVIKKQASAGGGDSGDDSMNADAAKVLQAFETRLDGAYLINRGAK